MGYSHQRLAAARTLLRTRELAMLLTDPTISEDAEEAVSGYLNDEFGDGDVDAYLEEHYPDGVRLPVENLISDITPILTAAAHSDRTPGIVTVPLSAVLTILTEHFTATDNGA